ncbi:MAG: 16S rRNA (uracil(1498)-N(3))-methyltransferase [Opitutae bacterium]|nr:16S rRNA (uracil(1498)-N(3))-methyltransferase [Opitutae bacterium]
MPDFRAYAPAAPADAKEIQLSPEESHHLVAVNRCGRGDPVTAFDGRGREWITACIDPSKSATVLRVKESRPARPRPHEITLAQALPKGATMDDIVRQATEIGAARIVPLLSERTQVHLDGDRAEKKIEKWRTAAIEAAKQCGNPWLPEIAALQKLEAFLATLRAPDTAAIEGGTRPPEGFRARPEAMLHLESTSFDLKLIASLHGGASTLKKSLAGYAAKHGHLPRKALWLVGPEGDFSPVETTAAISAGFQPITLGPLVLRSDTAAVYALSILSHALQE